MREPAAQRIPPHVEELSPPPDPLVVVAQLRDLSYPVFLDSAIGPDRLGHYSFVAADPPLIVTAKDGRATLQRDAGEPAPLEGDPLLALQALLAEFATDPIPGLPPFQGGAAGYIGYDYGASLERLPRPMFDDLGIPDVVLGVYDWVIAWDHQQQRAWLISTGLPATGREERAVRARARAGAVRERLQSPVPETRATRPPRDDGARGPAPPTFVVDGHPGLRSSYPHDGYLAAVARVRDYIIAGDIFQANLSQRLEAEYAGDPWSLYCRLRAINPAPFAAYFEAPGLAVVSAFPLSVSSRSVSMARSRRGRSREPAPGALGRNTMRTSGAPLSRARRIVPRI